MSNNSSPCMTCALRYSYPHTDPKAAAHADAVFREFKKHYHPRAFRVHDLTGPKEENESWYCSIGDSHFNKDNVKCPEWIPANGISPAEALNLHMIKPQQRKWFEKPYGLIAIGVIIVIVGFLFTQPIYDYIKTRLHKEQQQQMAVSLPNAPKKIPSRTPPWKKSDATISQPTISASNSNIFIGSNTGTVYQTINNEAPQRTIPIDKLPLLRAELSKHQGASILIQCLVNNDESFSLAKEFKSLFIGANWTVGGIDRVFFSGSTRGLIINMKDISLRPKATFIAQTLQAAGFKSRFNVDSGINSDIALLIGSK